ncbi:hypothetical protein [Promicromonospora sp. NFX87]|uniref:hypothetical protein n=1 Tax=Promicromonospora sp. NFX87 TaxID=3402691 RepID=UPI003AFB5CB4
MTTSDPTLAVVVARLDDLRSEVSDMRVEVRTTASAFLPRTEWELWRASANREIAEARADAEQAVAEARHEASKVRTEIDGRRIPWTAVVAAVVAIASLALNLWNGA